MPAPRSPSGRESSRAARVGELWDRCSMLLRERLESDLEACELIARAVHEVDRYPTYLPEDLRVFMATPDALGRGCSTKTARSSAMWRCARRARHL